jgi:hypothetical protein
MITVPQGGNTDGQPQETPNVTDADKARGNAWREEVNKQESDQSQDESVEDKGENA